MTKRIAIELNKRAFLPEAYAYRDYFISNGYDCDFVEKGEVYHSEYDALILFHGFHPFWRKYPAIVISEYHSLSVGRFGRFKDLIKRLLNVRGGYHIFLNDMVRRKLWYRKKMSHSLRGMGFNASLLENRSDVEKQFDIIYAGSMRAGVIEEIKRLASYGLTVVIVGFEIKDEIENVTFFGRVDNEKVFEIMSKARYGLNYTPDEFPLNQQDSTKVIEYCAARLPVITNRYKWVNRFEIDRSAEFITLESITSKQELFESHYVIPNVSDLVWERVVQKPLSEALDNIGL